jgi:hypothetical protein
MSKNYKATESKITEVEINKGFQIKPIMLISLAVIIWITNNIYFGWNATPVNEFAKFFDNLSSILFFWGIIKDILNNVSISKNVSNYNITEK